jgi:hypothetical protein
MLDPLRRVVVRREVTPQLAQWGPGHEVLRRIRRRLVIAAVLPFVAVVLATTLAYHLSRLPDIARARLERHRDEHTPEVKGTALKGEALAISLREGAETRQLQIRHDKQGWIVEEYPAGVNAPPPVERVEPPNPPHDVPRRSDWREPR